MNRIEAINAMLDGKVVTTSWHKPMRIHDGHLEYYSEYKWNQLYSSATIFDDPSGYTICETPADTIRLIINGKTFRAVEE